MENPTLFSLYLKSPVEYSKNGISGDLFSIKNKVQFEQITATYNELNQQFGIWDCFIDNNIKAIIFFAPKDLSSKNEQGIRIYAEKLSEKRFDIYDHKKNKNLIFSQ